MCVFCAHCTTQCACATLHCRKYCKHICYYSYYSKHCKQCNHSSTVRRTVCVYVCILKSLNVQTYFVFNNLKIITKTNISRRSLN